MKSCWTWCTIAILLSLLCITECRQPLYIIPASVTGMYLFFNLYPSAARRMHQRKLTYEDLEDWETVDPELQKRFQLVFTRIQQIGGACCAGILVAYGWVQWHSDAGLFETIGILGGLISLYARLFGYVGGACISCLYRLKRTRQYTEDHPERPDNDFKHLNPNTKKPQETKEGNDVL